MNYLLLIYANESEYMGLGETALQKMTAEYTDFTKSIVQGGELQGGRSPEARVIRLDGARAQR